MGTRRIFDRKTVGNGERVTPNCRYCEHGGEVSYGITDCSVKGIRRAVGPRKCYDFSVDGLKYEDYEKG